MKAALGERWNDYKALIRTWWTANADSDPSLADAPNRDEFNRILTTLDAGEPEAHANDEGEDDEQSQNSPDMESDEEFRDWVHKEFRQIEEMEERIDNESQVTSLVNLWRELHPDMVNRQEELEAGLATKFADVLVFKANREKMRLEDGGMLPSEAALIANSGLMMEPDEEEDPEKMEMVEELMENYGLTEEEAIDYVERDLSGTLFFKW